MCSYKLFGVDGYEEMMVNHALVQKDIFMSAKASKLLNWNTIIFWLASVIAYNCCAKNKKSSSSILEIPGAKNIELEFN